MTRRYSIQCVVAFAAAAIAASALYLSANTLDVEVKLLTRDPYRAAEVPPYYGFFSLLGSSIWLFASTATVTTAVVARKRFGCRLSDPSTYRIVALGGIFGLILAFDDILLFHDEFVDVVGIPELLVHVMYLLLGLFFITYGARVLRRTPWPILFAAFGCLGISSFIDLVGESIAWPAAINQSEDVFKFSAIVLWAFYCLATARQFVADLGSDLSPTDRPGQVA
jgi:hypothetical protein